jgi:hypothetical protein
VQAFASQSRTEEPKQLFGLNLEGYSISSLMDDFGPEPLVKAHAHRVAGTGYPGHVRAVCHDRQFRQPFYQQMPGPLSSGGRVNVQVVQPDTRLASKGRLTVVIESESNWLAGFPG